MKSLQLCEMWMYSGKRKCWCIMLFNSSYSCLPCHGALKLTYLHYFSNRLFQIGAFLSSKYHINWCMATLQALTDSCRMVYQLCFLAVDAWNCLRISLTQNQLIYILSYHRDFINYVAYLDMSMLAGLRSLWMTPYLMSVVNAFNISMRKW